MPAPQEKQKNTYLHKSVSGLIVCLLFLDKAPQEKTFYPIELNVLRWCVTALRFFVLFMVC